MIDLQNLTISKARKALDSGEYSALDLTRTYLAEIKKKDGDIHAYLEVFSDAEEQAKEADKKIKAGDKSLLLGVPIAVKDNILIKGRRASAASKILENYVAPYDATAIAKLKSAGAVFLGRTNMDEFAMGSSTEHSAYGPTRNPYDLSRVPGGSSGGSAAAVAANMALAALGSDTAGSIRQPASFCGLVGFKPSYGAVSRHGLMAMGSSLDVIGPIAKTVSDAEMIFSAIKGKDVMDSTSVALDLEKPVSKKIRIGDLSDFIEQIGKGGMDKAVMKNYAESLEKLAKIGYEIKKIKTDLTPITYSLPAYYVIIPAEVSANLARFDGVRYGFYADSSKKMTAQSSKDGEHKKPPASPPIFPMSPDRAGNLIEDYKATRGIGFGPEPRRRIILGTYVLSSGYYDAYYGKAMAIRTEIKKTFDKVWKEADLVATPTAPTPAFKIGEKTADPVQMYLADVFTIIANMAGLPAVSLPSGFSEVEGKKLPLGFQLMAGNGEDGLLFSAGGEFLG